MKLFLTSAFLFSLVQGAYRNEIKVRCMGAVEGNLSTARPKRLATTTGVVDVPRFVRVSDYSSGSLAISLTQSSPPFYGSRFVMMPFITTTRLRNLTRT